ncbi:heavy metal translocating P-type ATPase [Chitinophagaceae bacterium MMS25-I14]
MQSDSVTIHPPQSTTICYHCGTPCLNKKISIADKYFCCEGCKLVYEILDQNGLCNYYHIQNHPGLSQVKAKRADKFSFLDQQEIATQLYSFTDGNHTTVSLYIPGVHCSSCMWLLEHLHKLLPGVTESRLNFSTKELTVRFNRNEVSLRQIVEMMTTIGYEPYISLEDADNKSAKKVDRKRIYKLGIAGFCFGNIMMMSFPEYFSLHTGIEQQYAHLFRYLNLALSLPVFFYCASEFWINAWKGLQQKMLNIDAPIALAILITFSRSIYEIATNTGSGYLDSMSGIIFFMLVGRLVQERTYRSISFHRDYKSYFPIAVTVCNGDKEESRSLHELKEKDVVLVHNEEIIPADGILVRGDARIDYSFVTGESEPVLITPGNMLYAGGRQAGTNITMQVTKPVASAHLTALWNHHSFRQDKQLKNEDSSTIHLLSKYFTYILFSLAIITAVYWSLHDTSRILPSVTAMLIVACPCALLLSATYTNGNLMRIFSASGLYLRDAAVIEPMGRIDHIVFDKTGTLTQSNSSETIAGHTFTPYELQGIYTVAAQSQHPYSKALQKILGRYPHLQLSSWEEHKGKGIEAFADGHRIRIGTALFTEVPVIVSAGDKAQLYVRFDDKAGSYHFATGLRTGAAEMIRRLKNKFRISLLSGDHNKEQQELQQVLGADSRLLFEQQPEDKLRYIARLQHQGDTVLMIGDGLNDAGALRQSDVGITLAADVNNFTPSCDAILDAARFNSLPDMLSLARAGGYIIRFSFLISILYNIAGLYFAIQGRLIPVIAAILMPLSTLSIVLITTGLTTLTAKYYRLKTS